MKKIRENGFALDDEENTPGVRCLAAPIFDRFGKGAAALSLTGPVQQITDDQVARVAEKVKEAVSLIKVCKEKIEKAEFEVKQAVDDFHAEDEK